MESLTTAIVNTGQFNVVERNKLNTVLKELEIGLTGLADANKAKKVGELLQADVILTGTFADLGGFWNVNMRLINVRTGLVTAAFEERASFSEIKPEVVRDANNLNESFDGANLCPQISRRGRRSQLAHGRDFRIRGKRIQ